MDKSKKILTIKAKLIFLIFVFFILSSIILYKIVTIKIFEYDKWSSQQKQFVYKTEIIKAIRGNILSDEDVILVTSVPYYELRWDSRVEYLTDKRFNENIDSLSYCLSKVFNKSFSYFYNKLTKARAIGNRYTLIAKKVKFPQLEKVKQCPLFRLGKFKGGLIVNIEEQRIRLFDYSSRTLGYKKDNGFGIGLEDAFNKYLKGVDGSRLVQKITANYYREVKNSQNVEPKNGYDIRTTFNLEIEDITHNSLLKMLKATNADHGVAIVMEVKTGDIKAISNLGIGKDGNYTEKYNYAIGELYEPGSTFKLASMIVALDQGVIDLTDSVDTRGGKIKYYNHIMRDAHMGLGKISMLEAFAYSSNVAISQIIYNNYKSHPEDFIDRLYAMHFNDKLNIGIKGEKRPIIHYPGDKYWSGISLPQISIGYEVKVTPLHLLTFYNAIANGGKMVKPRFVSAVLSHEKVIKKFDTQIIENQICSEQTIKKAHKLLEAVVDFGTAKNIKSPFYKIAGKTGTAKLANKNEGYKKSSYVASFVGYFPADNPRFSIIVVIFDPKGRYYGSQVAAPVFKEIADKLYATQFELHTPINLTKSVLAKNTIPIVKYGYAEDIKKSLEFLGIDYTDKGVKGKWVVTSYGDSLVVLKNRFIVNNLMPNVKGMGLKDAIFILNTLGLKVKAIGEGKVVYQSVNPSVEIKKGEEVILKLM